ncbi:hypothetical protein ABEB36_013581 [Hypothenemus hampei]|uniref:Uncharacterized protein n=1 Tax=Hypothenemus hampei TaxID=57062 RepID=A0ABD1E4M2_HYPHA
MFVGNLDAPVQVGVVGAGTGPPRPSAEYCPALEVDHQARVLGRASGEEGQSVKPAMSVIQTARLQVETGAWSEGSEVDQY